MRPVASLPRRAVTTKVAVTQSTARYVDIDIKAGPGRMASGCWSFRSWSVSSPEQRAISEDEQVEHNRLGKQEHAGLAKTRHVGTRVETEACDVLLSV